MKNTQKDRIIERFFAPLLDGSDKLATLRNQVILDSGAYYFDWTASGLAYREICTRLSDLLPYYANTHSHFSIHASLMSDLYESAKSRLAQYLGLNDEFVLIAGGSGASFAIKKFQEILGIYVPPRTLGRFGNIKPENLPQVILSGYEHHSNELSYREGLCEIYKIDFDSKGVVSIESLGRILKTLREAQNLQGCQVQERAIIASLSAASNVTGILTPIQSCSQLVRESGGIVAVDMASLSAYENVSCELFDAVFLAPHKLLGGVGSCGLLVIKKSLIDTTLPPSFSGGGVIEYANDTQRYYVSNPASREEAGTPPIMGLLCASLAYQLRNEVGLEWIRARKSLLTKTFVEQLSEIPGARVYGNLEVERLGIVSFNIDSVSPIDLCVMLSQRYGIQTRAGCSCAGPYGHYLIPEGKYESKPIWIRVSLHYMHTLEDIEYLICSIRQCVQNLRP